MRMEVWRELQLMMLALLKMALQRSYVSIYFPVQNMQMPLIHIQHLKHILCDFIFM